MNPREELRSEIEAPVTAGAGGPAPVAGDARETGVQVLWGVWKVFIIILAALMGAMAVEGVRALL